MSREQDIFDLRQRLKEHGDAFRRMPAARRDDASVVARHQDEEIRIGAGLRELGAEARWPTDEERQRYGRS